MPFAYHTDNKSTPYAATDQTGNVAERYDIEPFGMRTVTLGSGYSQPIGSRIGLHGGWQDPINARLYFRARVFDPILARFLSRDPLGVWGDALNLGSPYGFTGNNPTLYRDPTGLGWFSDFCSGAVNVIAGAADGAISAVTFGIVDSPVVGNLMGADTESMAYQASSTLAEIGTTALMTAASGGGSAGLRTAIAIGNRVGDAVDLYRTASDVYDSVESGNYLEAALTVAGSASPGGGNRRHGPDAKLGATSGNRRNSGTKGTVVPEGKVVKVTPTSDGLEAKGRPMSPQQGQRAVDGDEDVFAADQKTAREVAGRDAVGPELHPREGEVRFPYYHRSDRRGGHVFFGEGEKSD